MMGPAAGGLRTRRARIADSPLWPMLWKEFIQMRRDRLTLGMMLGIPSIQLILFGFAIKTEVRHLPTVVLDQSRSSESRALVDVLRNTGNFDIRRPVRTPADVSTAIASGEAAAALVIAPDYYRDVKRGRPAHAQMIVDAADPLASSAALSGAVGAGAARASALAAQRFPTAGEPLVDLRVRPWYNPGLRNEAYIVPGLIGVLLSMTMMIITSIAIVRERERGTLEQLAVTPIDRPSLMLGKILPFVLVGYVQMTVVIVFGRLLFDVPILGSLPLLYLITLGFIMANLAIGLFISTIARTQMQAMQISFFFMLPNILLSGFLFPRVAMPAVARWVGMALPLTYYLRVLRGVFLKGVGFDILWPETLTLATFALVLVTLSVRRFSRSIE